MADASRQELEALACREADDRVPGRPEIVLPPRAAAAFRGRYLADGDLSPRAHGAESARATRS